MKVSIILPAYNEAENLKTILPEIYRVLGREVEILVMDDGSTDDTAVVAKGCGATVLSSPYNMGNGAAVKRGIRGASGEVIVLMDSDGQHQPKDLPVLLGALEGYDMVVGSRKPGCQSWYRGLANAAYNVLATYVSGVPIKDLTSGFRVFRRDKALRFVPILPNTFSYPATLTLSFIASAFPVRFVDVDVLRRDQGVSKINLFGDGTRFLIIIMRIAVFFSPLKVFLPVALLFFFTGLAYYFYTFLAFHRFTNMSALLFTTSVIIFMLGLVSEQIASLRMSKPGEDN